MISVQMWLDRECKEYARPSCVKTHFIVPSLSNTV